MNINDKIGLGTVQFGLNYGISNVSGKISYDSARKIVTFYCSKIGEPFFDTASAYGDSEAVLGRLHTELHISCNSKFISKFSNEVVTCLDLRNSLNATLNKLQVTQLYAYLAHDADVLVKNPDIYNELINLKSEGYIKKIGVSAYYPSQIESLINIKKIPDIIQIPYNVFDRRFESFFEDYIKYNIEVHSRSAFLQGLFFRDVDSLPDYFLSAKYGIQFLQNLSKDYGLALNKLLLLFCLSQPGIKRVIIGVESENNILDNMISEEDILKYNGIRDKISINYLISDNIMLPFKWPKYG